jgi:hypothetical protein
MTDRYEVVYNVSLLDDIHNYFPALLYDSGRFNSLAQVFHYVRHQMNTRFNLFSYGASRYVNSMETVAPEPIPTVILTPQMAPMAPPQRRPAPESDILTNLNTTSLLLSLLELGAEPGLPRRGVRGLGGGLGMRDVVVRPTPQQIEAGTEIISGASLTEETRCAICQDSVSAADACRRLRHCAHTYHQVCIDQWFQRSVFCPTCRHDIREVVPDRPL